IQITLVEKYLDAQALIEVVAPATLVVDCTDNLAIRFALNAACVAAQVPLVSGAAIRLEGQVTVFDARHPDSACYRCLYEEDSDDLTCAANGVLAPLVGVIGSMQALEAIKIITGFGTTLTGRLLLLDARHSQWRELKLIKDKHCPVCAKS